MFKSNINFVCENDWMPTSTTNTIKFNITWKCLRLKRIHSIYAISQSDSFVEVEKLEFNCRIFLYTSTNCSGRWQLRWQAKCNKTQHTTECTRKYQLTLGTKLNVGWFSCTHRNKDRNVENDPLPTKNVWRLRQSIQARGLNAYTWAERQTSKKVSTFSTWIRYSLTENNVRNVFLVDLYIHFL